MLWGVLIVKVAVVGFVLCVIGLSLGVVWSNDWLSHGREEASDQKTPVVILISIDGFRYDYFGAYDHPNLERLASEGVRLPLSPAYPSLTFPNHWSLATGLNVESHGIVSNTFYDPLFNETFFQGTIAPKWWLGEPIWWVFEFKK
jgi:predicted AlkP superfamily pyrophosphatase or phosphodiesterase